MEAHDSAMSDMLMSIGVDQFSAQKCVGQLSKKPESSFIEAYCRGAIVREANDARRSIGVKGLHALDMCNKKADGSPWDCSKKADRKQARDLVDREDPTWIIGSQPLTVFSLWTYGMSHRKMDPQVVQLRLHDVRIHLKFVC